MNSSRLAVGLVGLCLVGLWYAGGGANPVAVTRAADAPPPVAAPLTHENLSVYLVFGPDAVAGAKVMTLQEALDRDLATVHETGNVNTLSVENRSGEYELFVQSGDIVKGGKQDRVVQHDMLLPPRSGVVPLPAHCVEQSRWSGRGAEDAKTFAKSDNFAAGRGLRYANYAGEQHAVWANVKDNQAKLTANLSASVNAAASPTSFQLTLEADAVRARVAAYESALRGAAEDRDDVVGVVFAVNGQVVGAEVYGSNALFRKAWPKLLTAAAVEAVAERDAPASAPPSAREVEHFLAHGAAAEPIGPVEAAPRAEDPVALELTRVTLRNPEPLARERREVAAITSNVSGRVANPGRAAVDNVATDEPGRARTHPSMRGAGVATPGVPTVASPDNNRLNSSTNENRSTLMVESRDAGRANAVIHRSYIKK